MLEVIYSQTDLYLEPSQIPTGYANAAAKLGVVMKSSVCRDPVEQRRLLQGRTGRPKVGQGRACTIEAKAFSSTHRTKVFADGTVRKI